MPGPLKFFGTLGSLARRDEEDQQPQQRPRVPGLVFPTDPLDEIDALIGTRRPSRRGGWNSGSIDELLGLTEREDEAAEARQRRPAAAPAPAPAAPAGPAVAASAPPAKVSPLDQLFADLDEIAKAPLEAPKPPTVFTGTRGRPDTNLPVESAPAKSQPTLKHVTPDALLANPQAALEGPAWQLGQTRIPEIRRPSGPRATPETGAPDYRGSLMADAPEASPVDRGKDLAISLAKGTIGLGEAAVGLSDLVRTFGAVAVGYDPKERPTVSGLMAKHLGWNPRQWKAWLDQHYSPEQQQELGEFDRAQGFAGTLGALASNPSVAVQQAAESAPSMVGGARVARALPKVVNPLVGAAVGEGTVTAGQNLGQIVEETGNLTGQQAALGAASGIATGVINLAFGKMAARFGYADVDSMLAGAAKRPAVRQAIESVTAEAAKIPTSIGSEAAEELLQTAQETIATNLATGKAWDHEIGKASAAGAVTGGVMGGGAAVSDVGRRALAPAAAPAGPPPTVEQLHELRQRLQVARQSATDPARAQAISARLAQVTEQIATLSGGAETQGGAAVQPPPGPSVAPRVAPGTSPLPEPTVAAVAPGAPPASSPAVSRPVTPAGQPTPPAVVRPQVLDDIDRILNESSEETAAAKDDLHGLIRSKQPTTGTELLAANDAYEQARAGGDPATVPGNEPAPWPRAVEFNEAWGGWKKQTETVTPSKDWLASQGFVNRPKVDAMKKDPSVRTGDAPIIVRTPDGTLILDGHHALAAAMETKRSIDVTVYEKPAAQASAPGLKVGDTITHKGTGLPATVVEVNDGRPGRTRIRIEGEDADRHVSASDYAPVDKKPEVSGKEPEVSAQPEGKGEVRDTLSTQPSVEDLFRDLLQATHEDPERVAQLTEALVHRGLSDEQISDQLEALAAADNAPKSAGRGRTPAAARKPVTEMTDEEFADAIMREIAAEDAAAAAPATPKEPEPEGLSWQDESPYNIDDNEPASVLNQTIEEQRARLDALEVLRDEREGSRTDKKRKAIDDEIARIQQDIETTWGEVEQHMRGVDVAELRGRVERGEDVPKFDAPKPKKERPKPKREQKPAKEPVRKVETQETRADADDSVAVEIAALEQQVAQFSASGQPVVVNFLRREIEAAKAGSPRAYERLKAVATPTEDDIRDVVAFVASAQQIPQGPAGTEALKRKLVRRDRQRGWDYTTSSGADLMRGEAHPSIASPASRPAEPQPVQAAAAPREEQTSEPRAAEPSVEPYSPAAMKEAFNLTEPQAEAVDALVSAMGLDVEQIQVTKGGLPGDGALQQEDENATPPFYSRLQRAVEESKQQKGTGAQWKGIIKNAKIGQSADEYAFAHVEDLEGGKSYTKQEVLDYLKANEVRIVPIVLGEASPNAAEEARLLQIISDAGYTVASNEVLGDTENPDELYLERDGDPVEDDALTDRRIRQMDEADKSARAQGFAYRSGPRPPRVPPAVREAFNQYAVLVREDKRASAKYGLYQQVGADEGSYREVLLTVPQPTGSDRVDSMTEEELRQWYEDEVGYDPMDDDPSMTVEQLRAQVRRTDREAGGALASAPSVTKTWYDGHPGYGLIDNPIVRVRFNVRSQGDRRVMFLEEIQPPVPEQQQKMPALFTRNWREIGLKWALRYAAENGLDTLAWTTGQTQADRYSLETHVKAIRWGRPLNQESPRFRDGIKWIAIELKAKPEFAIDVDSNGVVHHRAEYPATREMSGKTLDQVLSKDVATRILEGDDGTIEGEGLKIGGVGLKRLYDVDLPAVLSKISAVKRSGVKVGTTTIDRGNLYAEYEYVGPTYTSDELVAKANAAQSQAEWTADAANDGLAWRKAAASMNEGASFASAMKHHMTASSAKKLGGEMRLVSRDSHAVPAIAITPELRQAVMGGQPLFQGPKGSVEFSADGKALIRGLENPDISSALHEVAHVARRQLLNRNVSPDLRSGITDEDIETAEAWAGATDGVWTVEAEEKLARGFERYLRDGLSPFDSMAAVFKKIGQWLSEVYTAIAGSPINVEITPAMREVFDKLVTRVERTKNDKPVWHESGDVAYFKDVLEGAADLTNDKHFGLVNTASQVLDRYPSLLRALPDSDIVALLTAVDDARAETGEYALTEVWKDPHEPGEIVDAAENILHREILARAGQGDLLSGRYRDQPVRTNSARTDTQPAGVVGPKALDPESEALIERIVVAARETLPEIVRRGDQYVFTRPGDGSTWSPRAFITKESAQKFLNEGQTRKDDEFRQALRENTPERLQEQAAYWLKETPPASKPAAAQPVEPRVLPDRTPAVGVLPGRTPTVQPGRTPDGVTVSHNTARGSIEVKFTEKPDRAVIDKLKAAGFRWAKTSGHWYRRISVPKGGSQRLTAPAELAEVRALLGLEAQHTPAISMPPVSRPVAPQATAPTRVTAPASRPAASQPVAQPQAGAQVARERFLEVYTRKLVEAIARKPSEYLYPASDAPKVAEKMAAAIAAGTANLDSSAIKATAKELGIAKPNRATWMAFFAPPAPESRPAESQPTVIPGLTQVAISPGAAAEAFQKGDRVTFMGQPATVQERSGDLLRVKMDDGTYRLVDARKLTRVEEAQTPESQGFTVDGWVNKAKDTAKDLAESDSRVAQAKTAYETERDRLKAENEVLIAQIKAKLSGQVNMGIDPDIVRLVAQLLKNYVTLGILDFKEAVARFQADMGAHARPLDRVFEMGWRLATDERRKVADVLGAYNPAEDGDGAASDSKDVAEPEAGGQDDSARRPVAGSESGESRPDRRGRGRAGGPRRDYGTRPGAEAGTESGSGEGTRPAGTLPGPDRDAALTPQLYTITDADAIGTGSVRERVARNLAAIRVLKQLQDEKRPPTPDEQRTLVRYVGWGGLPRIFEPWKYDDGGRKDNEYWAEQHQTLTTLLSDEEYRRARNSTQNAHYTSPTVIAAMWDAVRRLGVRRGSALETSAGIGHFAGLMPADLRSMSWALVEKDPLTADIAAALYPGAFTQATPLEKAQLPNDHFTVAISNVPFGKIPITDPSFQGPAFVRQRIHNYFFAKALDKVAPGGLVAFITTQGTLDSRGNQRVREYLAGRADFLGAIRLPYTAFKANAGTEVVTDIIFLRKRHDGAAPAHAGPWTETREVELPNKDGQPITLWVNEYILDHPETVLGTHTATGKMRQGDTYNVVPPGKTDAERMAHWDANGARQLAEAITTLPENVIDLTPPKTSLASFEQTLPPLGTRPFEFLIHEGRLAQVIDGKVSPVQATGADEARIRGLLPIRAALREVYDLMARDAQDAAVTEAQRALNKAYDAFVKKHGFISEDANWRAFHEDPDLPLLLSLEDYDTERETASKTAIFTQRTMQAERQARTAETPEQALHIVLGETGRIDLDRAGDLLGITAEDAAKRLSDEGLIIDTPSGWQTPAAYLSGNVRVKLVEAVAAAEIDARYAGAVERLKAVIPEDIPAHKINVRLGASWLPPDVVTQFIRSVVGLREDVALRWRVTYSPFDAKWGIEGGPREHSSRYETPDVDTKTLLLAALNDRRITVRTPATKDTPSRVNTEATALARQRREELHNALVEWLFNENKERREWAVRAYNDRFNAYVEPKVDGSYLTFRGMSAYWKERIRDHQRNAVARVLQFGNTLFAHVVGAGKTLAMIASGMELRRMGLARKPLYVVPNHLISQWPSEFLQYYPNAKILIARPEDLEKENRRRFTARIASGDWDAVIMPYSAFVRVSMSPEAEMAYHREILDEIETAIIESWREEQSGESGNVARRGRQSSSRTPPHIKQLENMRDRIQAKLDKLANRPKDDMLSFEQLGVDALLVDEAHSFKNLYFHTRQQAAGIPADNDAQRATDLYLKVRYINQLTNYRNVVLATGTPVSNSMAEIFVVQKLLQDHVLKQAGIESFDAWLAQFGHITIEMELDPSGTGMSARARLAHYRNLGRLAELFRQVADVKMIDDLPELKNARPRLKGDKPETVAIPATDDQLAFLAELKDRADHLDPRARWLDNMAKITVDGRMSALDMRLIDRRRSDHPGSKLHRVAQEVAAIYHEWKDRKGTQLIFMDGGTPGSEERSAGMKDVWDPNRGERVKRPPTVAERNRGKDLYADLKKKLVKDGIPAAQIAFIHDIDDVPPKKRDAARKALFRKVREGQIRVLIGSSNKMGTGMNVQDRLVAEHNVDPTYKPSETEQRYGRILRQGNLFFAADPNFRVRILNYATQGLGQQFGFDAYMWQLNEAKAGFIADFFKGDVSDATTGLDLDQTVLTASEMKAIATGNPLILELSKAQAEADRLRAVHRGYQEQVREARWSRDHAASHLAFSESQVAKMERLASAIEPRPDRPTLKIEGHDDVIGQKEVGEAILAAVKKHTAATSGSPIFMRPYASPVFVGTYRGVDLWLMPQKDGTPVLSVLHPDDSPTGYRSGDEYHRLGPVTLIATVTEKDGDEVSTRVDVRDAESIASAVGRAVNDLPQRLEAWRSEVLDATGRVARYDNMLAGGFSQQKEFDAIMARLDDIQRQLGVGQEQERDQPVVEDDPEAGSGGSNAGGTEAFSFVEPISATVAMARRLWQSRRARAAADATPLVESSIEDVERRWREARGITPPSLRQRAREALDSIAKLTRHFPEISPSRSALEATAHELLLEHERAPKWAQAVAHNRIAEVTEGLSKAEADLLARALVLPDILKDIEEGLYDGGKELPFGYPDREALEADLRRVAATVERTPAVRAAQEKRQGFVGQLTRELVEADLLPASVLEDARYYHRQVMAYVSAQTPRPGGSGKEVRQRTRGFQKGRSGGGDFNTSYVEAEFEWVAQALTELKTKATLDTLKELADKTADLKRLARRANLQALGDALAERLGFPPDAAAQLVEQEMKPFNQRIAVAIKGVLDALAAGDYQLGDGFDAVVAELLEDYEGWQDEQSERDPGDRQPFNANHPMWWPLLAALVRHPSGAARWAGALFKAIREREQFIEASLGRQYIDRKNPEDLVQLAEEGYTTWQPKEGNVFFRAASLDERALQAVIAGTRQLTDADKRMVMAMGGPRETWIIPEWLATTLDHFGVKAETPGPLGALDRAWTAAIGAWKQLMLLSPTRIVRYNLNNTSGDADASIAYSPGVFAFLPRSSAFLHHMLYTDKAPDGMTRAQLHARMERLIELGVIDAGLTAVEIPDVNDLPAFRKLAERDPQSFMAWLASLGPKYFKHARRITQFRENILRLAAYDYMLEQVSRGVRVYAASNPARVEALRNDRTTAGRERYAALLARDLIGDYQAVSSFTQFMRTRTLPFFSFQEVNFKRYVRLLGNVSREGGSPTATAAKLAGAKAARVTLNLGVRLVLVNAFMVSVVLWNKLVWPDEDEEMRRRGREQLHLILGRYEDGSIRTIRIEGAFADFLEWAGLQNYIADVDAMIDADITVAEKLLEMGKAAPNKVVQLWEPVTKQLFEQISGKKSFPSAFRATPIRDRGEHLAGIAALDKLYATVTNKPTPPGNPVARLFLYRTDPGEAAYFDVRAKVAKWLESQGHDKPGIEPTAKSNALYYWKRAVQWDDDDAAEKWRREYFRLGGTARGMRQSIEASEPLGALSERDALKFRRTLTSDDAAILRMAETWYRRVYSPRTVRRSAAAGAR